MSRYAHVDRTDIRRAQDVPAGEMDLVTGVPMRKYWEPVYRPIVRQMMYADRRKTYTLEGDRVPVVPSDY